MKTICIVIGSFVLAAIFIAIPILFSASLCLEWHSFLSFILFIATIMEFCMIVDYIFRKINLY